MHNEVQKIIEKQRNNPWPKFLHSIELTGLRGWSGEKVEFKFPVCAIAGENGSGKSTILKAAASAYLNPDGKEKTYYPSDFFVDTAWDRVSGVVIKYTAKQGSDLLTFSISRNERWRYPKTRIQRRVLFQDVSRTLPIDATVGYSYVAKRTANELSSERLNQDLVKYYSNILGKTYTEAKLAISDADRTRPVGVVTYDGLEISQFHQGAGEDTTFDLLALIQHIPNDSLLIIDEVEASLHPRSQRRLIHFLLWTARVKQLQVLLSTHSPYILEELPPDARVFIERCSDGIHVLYGVTPRYALSKMDDLDQPDLYIFTEDEESSELVLSLLRTSNIEIKRIKCIESGAANVVQAVASATIKKTFPLPGIGIVDADKKSCPGCIALPGTEAPERQVITDIRNMATAEFSQRVEKSESSVIDALKRTMNVAEHHEWPSVLARELSETKNYTWTTLCSVWSKHCVSDQDMNDFITKIQERLSSHVPNP